MPRVINGCVTYPMTRPGDNAGNTSPTRTARGCSTPPVSQLHCVEITRLVISPADALSMRPFPKRDRPTRRYHSSREITVSVISSSGGSRPRTPDFLILRWTLGRKLRALQPNLYHQPRDQAQLRARTCPVPLVCPLGAGHSHRDQLSGRDGAGWRT